MLRRQRLRGSVSRPYGYAWVTARNVALSRWRLSRVKLVRHTVGADDAAPHLAQLQAREGAPESIERAILLREAFAQLSPDDQRIVAWKQAGLSAEWIALQTGKTVGAVNTAFTRAKQRLRRVLGPTNATDLRDVVVEWHATRHSDEPTNGGGRNVHGDTWLKWPLRAIRPWLVDDDS